VTTVSVLVVRHGQSTWNAEGRWQGWADPPLTALGEEQARETVEHLRDTGFRAVVSSDLQRARRTAAIIADGLGLGDVEVDPDLREHSVGLFQGNTTEENKRLYPEAWDGDRVLFRPGAESVDEVLARVIPALLRAARRHGDGDPLLVVSHGGVLRMLEQHLGVQRDFHMPNLGGRWFDVCDGTRRINPGELLVAVDPDHVTRPVAE
jgi:broad specificity phosphatase PhoE